MSERFPHPTIGDMKDSFRSDTDDRDILVGYRCPKGHWYPVDVAEEDLDRLEMKVMGLCVVCEKVRHIHHPQKMRYTKAELKSGGVPAFCMTCSYQTIIFTPRMTYDCPKCDGYVVVDDSESLIAGELP